MTNRSLTPSILISALISAPAVALMYLADQLAGLTFPPFDFFNWITRITPGPLLTIGIDLMIDTLRLLGISVANTAKTAEQIMAVVLYAGILTAAGVAYLLLRERLSRSGIELSGWIAGAVLGVPMILISLSFISGAASPAVNVIWLLALFWGWGAALERLAQPLIVQAMPATSEPDVERIDRRRFLVVLGASSATITVLGAGLGAVLANRESGVTTRLTDDGTQGVGPENKPLPNADDPVTPAPGTRPEYTPVQDHYRVFIQAEPSYIEQADWVLPITGLVANPVELTLDEIRSSFPRRDQFVTLSCISGRIGTSLISTTKWSGVSAQEILALVQPTERARYMQIRSADGFYETVDLDLIRSDERIMFAYEWDEEPIPKDHGFPLRIWIPDRYGMKQPKWITSIELMEEYVEGYWVERSWDEVAQMKTTSVIDTVAVNSVIEEQGRQLIPIGGIAHAGARGISKVEVRVDGGEWTQARLRTPLSETTWVVWRYDWPFAEGRHTFEVRCVEGDGTPQIEEMTPARPDGATGIHSVNANV